MDTTPSSPANHSTPSLPTSGRCEYHYSSKEKWGISITAALVFYVLSSPVIYQSLNISSFECKHPLQLLILAGIYFIILWVLMKFGLRCQGSSTDLMLVAGMGSLLFLLFSSPITIDLVNSLTYYIGLSPYRDNPPINEISCIISNNNMIVNALLFLIFIRVILY